MLLKRKYLLSNYEQQDTTRISYVRNVSQRLIVNRKMCFNYDDTGYNRPSAKTNFMTYLDLLYNNMYHQ